MSASDHELLNAYIDNELPPSERQALEERLQADVQLRAEMQSLRQTQTLLRSLPQLKAPRDFTLPQSYGRKRTLPFILTSTFSTLSSVAAVMLMALGAYFMLQQDMHNNGQISMPASAEMSAAPEPTTDSAPSAAYLRESAVQADVAEIADAATEVFQQNETAPLIMGAVVAPGEQAADTGLTDMAVTADMHESGTDTETLSTARSAYAEPEDTVEITPGTTPETEIITEPAPAPQPTLQPTDKRPSLGLLFIIVGGILLASGFISTWLRQQRL